MALPNPGMDFVPFDILTAEEMDDIVENIEALAAGTGLNDDAITAPKIVGLDRSNLTTDSNPYKFRVSRNSAANTGASSVFAKVVFDTEQYDTNNNFATGTYTAPVNGFYSFGWRLKFITAATEQFQSVMYKNGSVISSGINESSAGAAHVTTTGNDQLQLTAGDTMDVYITTSGAAKAIEVGATTAYFFGKLISRT